MFRIGDYVVCSGHGVAQVTDIEERNLGGEIKSFYTLKIVANGMTVMVPTTAKSGIRALVDSEGVNEVYSILGDHNIKIDTSTWNRRYREYMNKIKTGSISEIADVFRALALLKGVKPLSFGEKKMLDQCKELIAQELSLAKGEEIKNVENSIDACF